MGNEGSKGVGDGEGDRVKEKSNDSSRRRLMLESCSLSVCLSLPGLFRLFQKYGNARIEDITLDNIYGNLVSGLTSNNTSATVLHWSFPVQSHRRHFHFWSFPSINIAFCFFSTAVIVKSSALLMIKPPRCLCWGLLLKQLCWSRSWAGSGQHECVCFDGISQTKKRLTKSVYV